MTHRIPQTLEEYSAAHRFEMSTFGFTQSPLNDLEILCLWKRSVPLASAYSIACDVNAGIRFSFALEIEEERNGKVS